MYPKIKELFLTKVPHNPEILSRESPPVAEMFRQYKIFDRSDLEHQEKPMFEWIPDNTYEFLAWDSKYLIRLIARAFDIDFKYEKFDGPLTHQIAEVRGMPILLTIQPSKEQLLLSVAHMVIMLDQPFIVLAPTRKYFSARITEYLSRRNAGFFDLESHLTLQPNGMLQADKTGGELFSQYLPVQKESVSGNEATRLFALFKSLKSEPRDRKAPLIKVFECLVLDKRSQAETAKICNCSEGLISSRVKRIEKRMNLSVEQLRAFGSQLNDLNSQVRDSRARKIYQKGLVDDTQDDDSPD